MKKSIFAIANIFPKSLISFFNLILQRKFSSNFTKLVVSIMFVITSNGYKFRLRSLAKEILTRKVNISKIITNWLIIINAHV